MNRFVLTGIACLSPLLGYAANEIDIAEMRPAITQAPDLTDETAYLAVPGLVVDRVRTRDTDKFQRDTTRTGMMVHYASPHEFIALGGSRNEFRQGNWSGGVNSLFLAGRKINRRTAEGFTGRLEITTNTEKINWHGEGLWNVRFSERTGAELIGSRDAVETVGALKEGILSNFVAVSVDHALTERLTVIGMPTYQRFTDSNARRGWRSWAIYNLLPDYGVSVELKAQAYDSTGRSNGLYFSPEHYERNEAGLRVRRAFGNWRVFAAADFGRERINREIEKPTRIFSLTAQRSFANNVTAGVQYSYYQASSSGTESSTSDGYTWRMARAYLAIPF